MRATALFTLAALAGVAACDDDLGPLNWDSLPDTVAIYSLARPELLGLPSALNVASVNARVEVVRVELPGATGLWDVALSEEGGGFVLLPAGAVQGVTVRPGIAVVEGEAFEDVLRAPGDTAAYTRSAPVPVRTDVVYVIRSGQRPTSACVYYAKARAVALDASAGRLEIEVVRNPYCRDRYLVPPDER